MYLFKNCKIIKAIIHITGKVALMVFKWFFFSSGNRVKIMTKIRWKVFHANIMPKKKIISVSEKLMLIKQVSVMACGPFLWVKSDIILLGRLHKQIKCILNPLYPTLKSTLVKCYNHMMYAIIYSEFRGLLFLC